MERPQAHLLLEPPVRAAMQAVDVRGLVIDRAWWPREPHPADCLGLARAQAAGLQLTLVGASSDGGPVPDGVACVQAGTRDEAWSAWARHRPSSGLAVWLGDALEWSCLPPGTVLWVPSDAHPELLRRAAFVASRPSQEAGLREALDLWMSVHGRYVRDWGGCPWSPREDVDG